MVYLNLNFEVRWLRVEQLEIRLHANPFIPLDLQFFNCLNIKFSRVLSFVIFISVDWFFHPEAKAHHNKERRVD